MIGWALGVAASTVHAVFAGTAARGSSCEPPREEIVRYERSRPGELVHVDIKKLGRIVTARPPRHRRSLASEPGQAGWQYLYVAIDDHSRLGFASVYPDETADSRARLPRRARPLLRPTASGSSAC